MNKNKQIRATCTNVHNSQKYKYKYEGRNEVTKEYAYYRIFYINLKICKQYYILLMNG